MKSTPLVSVLICTYNRSHLLKRAIDSVLSQDFRDYELVIIDDCSTDGTKELVSAILDPRIRYFRNESNVASVHGDRGHVRRFIYELMRGKYFVYLCDDDYWISHTLLGRQIKAFQMYNNLAMVVGAQLSHFFNPDQPKKPPEEIHKVAQINYNCLYTSAHPPQPFFIKQLYSKSVMTSEEFLVEFSKDPIVRNIIAGATLFSKEHFIKSGAMLSELGSRWQAGYEFSMGPACCGGVVYFDQPEIMVEVRPTNASFQSTQIGHYYDSIYSVHQAFLGPLASKPLRNRKRFFKKIKRETMKNISRSYLRNTISKKLYNHLTICGDENIDCSVDMRHVSKIYIKNLILPKMKDLRYFLLSILPSKWLKKMNSNRRFYYFVRL